MGSKPRAFIPPGEAAYIEALIRDPDSTSRKVGLQRLCHFYRNGQILLNPAPIRVDLLGLLYDESEKVRRWALNSLALVGTSRHAEAILEAIQRSRGLPDLLGAGVAALASLSRKDDVTRLLIKQDLPLEGGLLLAVAQQSDAFDEQLRSTRVDIDKADAADLRMATLLVGLDRAPENLFSTRHPNKRMIGELNTHPDALTAQYSVWATVEHPLLGLKDLTLAMRDLESQPSNVRGWIYRLIASSLETAEQHIDILQTGSRDDVVEAREGLATGLRNVFSAAIEDLVVEWFLREQSDPVKQRLLEHMATVGQASQRYLELVLAVYRATDDRSIVRARLEAAAQGTQLYVRMKMIANDAERRDLFAASPPGPGLVDAESGAMTLPAVAAEGFPDANEVRVLIVTALPLEAAAVLATLDRFGQTGAEDDPNIYHIGVYKGQQDRAVIVCQSGMGKTNASTTAANALRTFRNVQHIIMVGIAGGCPNPAVVNEHVRLGDIVYSGRNGIIEYDFVKQTEHEREIRAWPQKPSGRLLNAAEQLRAKEHLGERPWEGLIERGLVASADFSRPDDDADALHDSSGAVIAHPEDGKRQLGKPKVHSGVIATSDTLQKDPAARDDLREKYGARAIEMEASGMQNAAWAVGKDIFVVRGVCDYCDPFKNDDWHGYAALVAAAFTRSLVEAMPKEWFPD